MKLLKSFDFRNQFFRGVILTVLILAFLRFPLLNRSFSHTDFTIETSEGEQIQGNFTSIQEAINAAENGSTIYVPPNVYLERIVVNKTISLIGENVSTTIIDGTPGGTVVQITADNVTITGFTIRNSGWGWTRNGIYIHYADNCKIVGNFLIRNCHNIRLNYSIGSQVLGNNIDRDGYGIRLINSYNCTAIANNVSNCIGGVHLQNATRCTVRRNSFIQNDQGVRMYSPCFYNEIMANTVFNNTYDGMIEAMPGNTTFLGNLFFHNNFINNTNPFIHKVSGNIWDNGYPAGGNYWSRYNGTDLFRGPYQNETGSDGIGDEAYSVSSLEEDNYPLMHPWSRLPIHNINTGSGYTAIQEAIDTNQTLDEHTLWVEPGTYQEHIKVYKSLKLIGENPSTTIIDGGKVGKVLSVNATNVSIVGFTVRNSGSLAPTWGDDCGVFLDHTTGTNMTQCFVINNRIGIYLFYAEDCAVQDNIVSSNNENGILLWYSGNNVLTRNKISNNSYNFGVFGNSFSHFNNTIDGSNIVDGRPIRYLIGVEDQVFDAQTDIGVLYLINSINITVENLDFTRNTHGVFCFNTTDSRIVNVTAFKNSYGIFLRDSSGNQIENNVCFENWVGIELHDSVGNVVEDNTAGNCEKGISLYEADDNSLTGNTFTNNIYGIRFYSSHFNNASRNNLVGNREQVSLFYSYQNRWDNGYEGNYWSDYNGSDINRDGIGDTPQIINVNNQDRYPLLGRFHDFNIYHQGSFHKVQVTSNSTILDFIYEEATNTIRLIVNGTDETYGFCRISIPHALMDVENLTVTIDNNQTLVLHSNYSLRDDGLRRWIYFAYQHSLREILIIPEFWSLVFLSTFIVVTLFWLLLGKKTDWKLGSHRDL